MNYGLWVTVMVMVSSVLQLEKRDGMGRDWGWGLGKRRGG